MSDRMASEEDGTRSLARACVLYLDDTDERAAFQSHVAETAAYSLDTVTMLDDACSALAEREYDCVVADLAVGPQTAHDVATTLAEATRETPLVAYTALDVANLAPETREAVTTIVQKADPIHRRFLAAKVESILSEDEQSRFDELSEAYSDASAGVFLVAADGTVETASEDFESVFPAEHASDMPAEGFYDRVAQVLDNGTAYHERVVEARDADEPVAGFVGSLTLPDGEQWSFAFWSLPLAGGRRVELCRDVTAELDRYENLDTFETLVDLAHDGLGVVDSNGRLSYCNEAYAELLGYDREELVGEQTYAIFDEGALEKGQRITQQVIEDPDERSQVIEMPHVTKDGERVWLATHAAVLPRPDGTYGGLVNVARDVTERRELEQTLREQRAHLQQQNDRLERLAADINDEFRDAVEAADSAVATATDNPSPAALDEVDAQLQRIRTLIAETLTVDTPATETVSDDFDSGFEADALDGPPVPDGQASEGADAAEDSTGETAPSDAPQAETRLLLLHVDGDDAARERVTDVFQSEPDIESDAVASVEEAVTALSTESYGCLVVDFATLDCPPAEFKAAIPTGAEGLPMVVFTADLPGDIYEQFADEEMTVVEKGGAANRSFFVQKVRSVTGIGQHSDFDMGWQSDPAAAVGGESDILGVVLAAGETLESTASPAEFFGTDAVSAGRFVDVLPAIFHDGERFRQWVESGEESPLFCIQPRDSSAAYYLCWQLAHPDDGTVVLFRDVTADVDRRDRLVQARTLVEQARDGIHVLDEQAVLVYCNEALADRVGYDRAGLIGQDVTRFVTNESLQRGQQKVQQLIENPDRESELVEIVEQQKDGTKVLTAQRFTLTPFDDDGTYTGLMAVSRDITERRQRVQRLRRQQRRLERKNQLLERFGSIVSHDLRNPLGLAETYLGFARDSHDVADLTAVADALDRMAEMLDELLSFVRMGGEIDERAAVDLAPLATDAWDTVAPERGDLTLECVGTTVTADRAKLRHVFENLFRNSVEHGRSADDGASDPVQVRVGTLPDREGFFVVDDGPGIPADRREDVFAYGYSSGDGTGIGLAIVKDVVDAHGWAITVTEGEDGGARFEIATAPDSDELKN